VTPAPALSHEIQNFIRGCLRIEPTSRMTTSEAKRHPWFQQQPKKAELMTELQQHRSRWNPCHTITPPVEELPDIMSLDDGTRSQPSKGDWHSLRLILKHNKHRLLEPRSAIPDSQNSPYFAATESLSLKRAGATPVSSGAHAPPSIRLIRATESGSN
jgi:serine/threonine protein kinase